MAHEESGWLVEYGDGPNFPYLGSRCGGLCSTYNPNEAIRFCRKEDAENMARGLMEARVFLADFKVVEHMWDMEPMEKGDGKDG